MAILILTSDHNIVAIFLFFLIDHREGLVQSAKGKVGHKSKFLCLWKNNCGPWGHLSWRLGLEGFHFEGRDIEPSWCHC